MSCQEIFQRRRQRRRQEVYSLQGSLERYGDDVLGALASTYVFCLVEHLECGDVSGASYGRIVPLYRATPHRH
jgi:hypothetical protein